MRKAKRTTTTFNTAHKRWLKAQARWDEMNRSHASRTMSEPAFDRLVDKLGGARAEASKGLAKVRSQDVHDLAAKTDALWTILLCDFSSEETAIQYGDFGREEFELFKSIRRDPLHWRR
jgi:hypothetical protein